MRIQDFAKGWEGGRCNFRDQVTDIAIEEVTLIFAGIFVSPLSQFCTKLSTVTIVELVTADRVRQNCLSEDETLIHVFDSDIRLFAIIWWNKQTPLWIFFEYWKMP